jgi:Putative transposase of IS4/5 family (DUF4096)
MKSGPRRVFRYSSRYEKTLPNGPFRCPMELHRVSLARPQRIWTPQNSHSAPDPERLSFYLLKSGCQWCLLPHDFPRWPTVYHYFRIWRIEKVPGRGSTVLSENASGSA